MPSRSPGGAFTTICFSVIIAVVRAFTAVSRAILSWRIISTAPSAVLGVAVDWPRQYRPGRGLGVEGVGLASGAAQAPVAPIHFYDPMPRAAHRSCQAGAIAAGAFNTETPQSGRVCRPT